MLRRLGWGVAQLLLMAGVVWGQGGQFLEAPIYTTGSFPASVAVGDFNNDGKMDVVVVNRLDLTIEVFLSNGDGTFVAQAAYPTVLGASSIAAGDFDGDGNLDVVLSFPSSSANQVGVIFGDGHGGFSRGPQQYNTAVAPEWVAVADLRKGGHLDLVTGNSGANTAGVSVLLNNGDGTFGTSTDYAIAGVSFSVALADVNGDGYPDIIAANGGTTTIHDSVSVLLNNADGTGTFGTHADYATGNQAQSVVAGDFNGDGFNDLAVANYIDNTVSILLNNKSGGFGAPTDYATGISGPFQVIVEQPTAGAPLDVAVVNSSTDTVSVLVGNGDGTFLPFQEFGVGYLPQGLTTGDFNGDGSQDLVAVNSGGGGNTGQNDAPGNTFSVLLGYGDGTFKTSFDYPAGVGAQEVAWGDFNNDGKNDYAVLNVTDQTVNIFLGSGGGTFTAGTKLTTGTAPDSIGVGTLVSGGFPSIVVANSGDNNVSVFLGQGDGTFQNPVTYGTGLFPASVIVHDFNGDGKPDIAVANENDTPGTVGVLLGNGDGTFGAQVKTGTGSGPTAIAAADFNADGKQDLVALFPALHTPGVAIMTGNNDGTFVSPSTSYAVGNQPISVAVGDFRNLGIADVAVTNQLDGTVSVLLGTNNGMLGPQTPYATGLSTPVGSTEVAVADFNGDGKLDLMVTNQGSPNNPGNTVGLLVGNGDGTFNPPAVYGTGFAPYGVAVADFNGDSVPDVVTANLQANNASVLLNAKGTTIVFTSSPNPSNVGQLVTLTATVGTVLRNFPAPTGTVTFFDGTTAIGSPITLSGGVATTTTSTLADGTHTLTAVYSGDGTYQLHTSLPVTQSVNQADFGITASALTPPTISPGQPTSSTVTITSTQSFTGDVSLTCTGLPAGASCGFVPNPATVPANGTVTSALTVSTDSTIAAGSYTITLTGTSGTLVHSTTVSFSVENFLLSATTPATISPGQNAASTVTVTSVNGFNSSVAFSCSGLPAGASCTFVPPSVTPPSGGTATSDLTIGTTTATPAGSYTLTITGTSGSAVINTTTVLTVEDFGFTATALTPAIINPGGSTSSTVTVTSLGGFSGTVSLSCSSGVPANATCAFVPPTVVPSPTGVTSTLTITTTTAITPATTTITLSGTSGSLTHMASVSLDVQDFGLSATALTPTNVTPGQSATSTVSVTSANGFVTPVALTCSGLPAGAVCTFLPATNPPPYTSQLTITTTGVAFGTYAVTVTGTAGSDVHSTTLTLSVQDFTVAATALSPAIINPSQSATSTVSVTSENGFSSAVNLNCTGLPTGANCAFAQNPVTPPGNGLVQTTLTISTLATVAPGNYTVTVTGTFGSDVRSSATLSLDIQDFGVTATALSPAIINPGGTTSSTATVTGLNGFTGPVTLSCAGLPPTGATCAFVPNPVTPSAGGATSALTITTTSAVLAGTYSVSVTGTAGSDVHTATPILLTIQDFGMQATAATPVLPGGSTTSTITVNSLNNFNSAVGLTCSGLPSGTTCTFVPSSVTPPPAGSMSSTLTLTTDVTTPPGSYTITVTGASGGDIHTQTVTLTVADFSIGASTPAPTLTGQPATSTVTVTPLFGFNNSVFLSCTGTLPVGASCTFVPSSVTPSGGNPATSTLTISGLTGTGSFSFTVQGSTGGGAAVHTTMVTVTVQDFSIVTTALTPVSVYPGSSATSTVTVTSLSGFNSTVTLTCPAGLPAGAACSFNPPTVTPAANGTITSALTVTTASTTVAGNYVVTVQGSSGGGSRSSQVTLGVQDFGVAATAPASVTAGQSTTSTVTVTSLGSFSSPVTLSCTGLPAGATCTFVPNPATPPVGGIQAVTLTLGTSSTTPVGIATVTITGTASGVSHSTTVSLNVQDYTVAATALTPSEITPGGSASSTITVGSLNGFSSAVALTCSGLPTGATCAFVPGSVTPPSNGSASSTLTISTSSSTPLATSTVTITGTVGSTTHTATVTLVVQSTPDFGISATALTPASVNAGQSGTSTVTISSLVGFNSAVTLTCSGLPAGATCAFNPASPTPASGGTVTSALTITTATSTPAGTSTVTVTGTSGSLVRSATLTLTVVTTPDFTVAATTPAAVTVGQSTTSTVTVTSVQSFSSAVGLSCSGLPAGATCAFNPTPVTPAANGTGTSTLTIATASTTPLGAVTVTIAGTSGTTVHTTTVTLTVLGVQGFTVGATPLSPAVVNAGGSGTSTVTVTSVNSFNSAVTLACPSGLPVNATCSFNPAAVTPAANGTATSVLTIATSTATPVGASTVTVTGTSGTESESTTVTLTVAAFTLTAGTASPGSVSPGGSSSATVTVTSQDGFNSAVGLTCSVSPTPSLAPTCSLSPASVTPAANGTATSTLTISTTAATASLARPVIGHDTRPLYALWLPIPGIALLGAGLLSGGKRRKRLLQMLLGCALFVGLAVLVGCGGGSSTTTGGGNPGTPAGTYTVTVTGTSGGNSHSTTVTMTVQ